ncbi:MAG: hypothetical protein GWN86_19880, partial [Desulfobacterales bacterium]|nr:hypothetical protein [Desulfobacterales bacterium]
METTKYTLTITDGGTGLLDYALQVSVYKVNKGEGSEGLVVVDNSPSDPVKFELIPGTYQVSVAFDGVVLT